MVSGDLAKKIETDVSKELGRDVEIKQQIDIGQISIIRLKNNGGSERGDSSTDRNVFAFNSQGEKLWQIQECPVGDSPKPYMHIKMRDRELIAGNWIGVDLIVSIDSGEVKPDPQRMGRPW